MPLKRETYFLLGKKKAQSRSGTIHYAVIIGTHQQQQQRQKNEKKEKKNTFLSLDPVIMGVQKSYIG